MSCPVIFKIMRIPLVKGRVTRPREAEFLNGREKGEGYGKDTDGRR